MAVSAQCLRTRSGEGAPPEPSLRSEGRPTICGPIMVIDVANIIALTVSAKIGMTVRHNPELTGQDTAPKPPVFPASKTDGIPPVLLPRIRCSERSWFRNDRLNNGPAVCRHHR